MDPRYYEKASRLYEMDSRYNEKISRLYENVSRLYEKGFRYNEVSRYYETVFVFQSKALVRSSAPPGITVQKLHGKCYNYRADITSEIVRH